MKRYVDGFVLPVQKKNLDAYKKMASKGGEVWMKYGALQYVECIGDDLKSAAKWGCLPFPNMIKAKSGETVVFSFIIYKSKAHRDKINEKVIKDPIMDPTKYEGKAMPFEMKRMAVGGFETIVDL